MNSKRSLAWVVLHILAIVFVVASLLTGLRIAILSKPYLLWLDALLPQGELHSLHILSACVLGAVFICYVLYLAFINKPNNRPAPSVTYHKLVTWFGYLLIVMALLSGTMMYADVIASNDISDLHYLVALGFVLYLFLHGGGYFVEYGLSAFKRILNFESEQYKQPVFLFSILILCFGLFVYISFQKHSLPVYVTPIGMDQFIKIDGLADEAMWNDAVETQIITRGGKNFVNGSSRVTVKALQNGVEMYLHLTWEDPSKSLKHLPLKKTNNGWQVQQNGFHHFDEVDYYEDKFAIMLSSSCELGGAGTMHLGSKPLQDKPTNWHGKGYHYADDGVVRDLWHWKAARTNDMYLMDDNYVGKPDIIRPASRRYTAGYFADGKESGAYVMNWKWYKPGIITPKRLPINETDLIPYQTENEELDWVVPWFSYEKYDAKKDTFPVGTVMPSVMYRSNRFEGDRADVRARGVWKNGTWSLELARKLKTKSDFDVPLEDGVCFWVSAFDHSQIAHTRHNQSLQFHFEVTHD